MLNEAWHVRKFDQNLFCLKVGGDGKQKSILSNLWIFLDDQERIH